MGVAFGLPRGVHEAVWGLFLVMVLGRDPMVGVLAIAIPFGAITAKVYAEMIDESAAGPFDALVTGESAGKGKFYGDMVLSPGPSPDQFVSKTTLHFADGSGQEFCEDGTSIVYTGFQWRGRSNVQQPEMVPGTPKTVREVMMVSPDQAIREIRRTLSKFSMASVPLRKFVVFSAISGRTCEAIRTLATL